LAATVMAMVMIMIMAIAMVIALLVATVTIITVMGILMDINNLLDINNLTEIGTTIVDHGVDPAVDDERIEQGGRIIFLRSIEIIPNHLGLPPISLPTSKIAFILSYYFSLNCIKWLSSVSEIIRG